MSWALGIGVPFGLVWFGLVGSLLFCINVLLCESRVDIDVDVDVDVECMCVGLCVGKQ